MRSSCDVMRWLKENPIAGLPLSQVGQVGKVRVRRAYTREEFTRLLSVTPEPRHTVYRFASAAPSSNFGVVGVARFLRTPIDVGRQLFVDDFLVAKTTLTWTHHRPAYHPKSPVLTGGMVFSDGVWFDPRVGLFKMWYMAKGGTAYATSKDGISWEKPALDVKKGTNLVQTSPRDSSTVWLDFASMDAGEKEGTLTTRPVRFTGRHLFVNLDAPLGEMRVEVLDERSMPVAGFTRHDCPAVRGKGTAQAVTWNGRADLASLANKVVRFRFHLRQGKLYAFWVSPEKGGASHGYVAAGGPGFTGPIDTVGSTVGR